MYKINDEIIENEKEKLIELDNLIDYLNKEEARY